MLTTAVSEQQFTQEPGDGRYHGGGGNGQHPRPNNAARNRPSRHSCARMKSSAVLINTGRGGLIDTPALIGALKSHRIGAVGLDVYEEEADVFFEDLSQRGIDDDVLARLLTFPNVLVTAHQGFLTREALHAIALVTLNNALQWQRDGLAGNALGMA